MTTLVPTEPGTEVVVQLANGFEGDAHAAVTSEGPRWVTTNARTGVDEIIDPANVRSYTTVHRGRGFVEGLAIGGISGVVAGGLLGLIGTGKNSIISPEWAALYGAGIIGAIGVPVGGLIGAVVGSRDVHGLESKHAPKLSPMVGDGQAGARLTGQF